MEKNIIKIVVAGGSEKPYYLSKMGMSTKGCYIRVGSVAEPMPVRMIEDLFAGRIRNSIGTIKSRNQALTFEQLKIYYNETPLKLNDRFADNLELLTADGKYNYAAYLLSDVNGLSIKVGKYAGTTRVDLVENEEYGFCSIVKATKAVLEKFKVENKTFTKITDTVRIERKLLDPNALREIIINAIIHNNYSNEIPPKFELFSDRLEVTSAGGLPPRFDEEEFFMGYSVPQNKELMRVFRDLDMVEQMGSGVPRILKHYPKSIYHFSRNFIRVILPFEKGFEESSKQATAEVTAEVLRESKIFDFCLEARSAHEIMNFLGMRHNEHFRRSILQPLVKMKMLLLTIPDKPTSSKQKYYTNTDKIEDK